MKLALLPLLACPDCGRELRYAAPSGSDLVSDPGEIVSGRLACAGCLRRFPLEGGIPRLFPTGGMDARMLRTQESFAWEWWRYPGALEEDRRVFLRETQIPEDDWRGRTALDVGCGMGRYARVALDLGASVVAFDLSDAIFRLAPDARRHPHLHLVQGDVFRPPFRPGVFDIAYSQGVLHHTPDTRTAFRKVAPLVKRGGLLTLWVYGTPGPYRRFATNPLRPGREWIRFLRPPAWCVVWARQLFSDALRRATVRMPISLLYAFCVPLALLGSVPLLKYLTFSVHRDFRVRLVENFDWLAPPFQFKHTKEEVAEWFEASGYEVERRLPHGMVPKAGVLGRRL